jgi:hypothetical protein
MSCSRPAAEEDAEGRGITGRIILKLILKNECGWTWTELIRLRIDTNGEML